MTEPTRAPERGAEAERGLGLVEVFAVWTLLGVFGGAIFWTYARLPARDFFHVSTSGPAGGAGRALVFLNFPVALVAIALALIAVDRLHGRLATTVAVLAILLCAAVYWPGVVDQRDLDGRWVNAIAAVGVALALALTLAAARGGIRAVRRAPGDPLRVLLAVAIFFFALEYVTGEFGVFVNRIPGLGSIFLARQQWASFGYDTLRPAVHLAAIPSLLVPAPEPAFGAVVAAGVLLYLLVFRRIGAGLVVRGRPVPASVLLLPAAAVAVLVGLGAAADGRTVRSPGPTAAEGTELQAEGRIAFSMVDHGWDVMVARGDGRSLRNRTPDNNHNLAPRWSPMDRRLVFQSDRAGNPDVYSGAERLTADSASDGEPAWSPDGRLIAFVSTRDGNREIYVMRADGRGQRRLTRNGADDQWPRWSNPRRIVFQSNRHSDDDLYAIGADGTGLQRLTNLPGDERTPAPSHRGALVAFASNRAGDYDLYVAHADGTGLRRLTHDPGEDFGPAWSRDDRFLVFTSNLDGRDQLFVVRATGGGLARLTGVQADKDAPDWG